MSERFAYRMLDGEYQGLALGDQLRFSDGTTLVVGREADKYFREIVRIYNLTEVNRL